MLLLPNVVFFCVFFGFVLGANQVEIARAPNDQTATNEIIENYYGCKCVIYYQCDEDYYVIQDGRTLIDERSSLPKNASEAIACVDTMYFCCKLRSDPTPGQSTTTTETAPEITTLKPNVRNPDMEPITCGQSRSRFQINIPSRSKSEIVSTIPGEIPWIVAIYEKNSQGHYKFKCGGSLVSANVVLTAVHCIISSKSGKLKIVANGGNRLEDVGQKPANDREVSKLIKHPDYYSGGLYNDIALIILETPYDFKESPINSICLPTNTQESFVGKRCFAAGWGSNQNQANRPLQKIEVPIVEFKECQNLLRKTRLGPGFELDESFLCAGGDEEDTCKGDGGGPLVCLNENNHYVQVGIVSWGVNCARKSEPGVYTNVVKFQEWIADELENLM